MPRTDGFTLQFKDREVFGKFCMALREDEVSFSMGGFLTLWILRVKTIEDLPMHCQHLLTELQGRGLKVRHVYFVGQANRVLPTETKTISLLQEFTRRRAKRLKKIK